MGKHHHPWWRRWSAKAWISILFFRTIFLFLQSCCWRTAWTDYQSLFLIYQCRSIEVYVPPDLMQVAIIITHKKSITTLVWHHGYSELNTSGKNDMLYFWPVWLWRWPPHKLSKRQSLWTTRVLFRTTFTRTMRVPNRVLQSWASNKGNPGSRASNKGSPGSRKTFWRSLTITLNLLIKWLLGSNLSQCLEDKTLWGC